MVFKKDDTRLQHLLEKLDQMSEAGKNLSEDKEKDETEEFSLDIQDVYAFEKWVQTDPNALRELTQEEQDLLRTESEERIAAHNKKRKHRKPGH